MSRYIDADELKANINNWYDLVNSFGQTNIQLSHKDILAKIDNIPTIETKSIVYGKWIKRYVITDTKTIELNVCSECNEEFSYDAETGISMDNYNICPNCGADMRKEKQNDTDRH